jgi:transcriptional regulator with XRE-family HTH domain
MTTQAQASNLGATIKQLREGNGYTQQQLADFLGINRVMLAYFESEERKPGIAVLEKLASLFGLEVAELLAPDATTQALNAAFAFRSAGDLQAAHLEHIASFRRIVTNYLKMKRIDNKESRYENQ